MASQAVVGAWLRNRVSSTPRTRYGPSCSTAIPRAESCFAMKSVESRKPRPDTK